jgi:hypothetical protein
MTETRGLTTTPTPLDLRNAPMTTLYIDVDACPVKDTAKRVAERHWLVQPL